MFDLQTEWLGSTLLEWATALGMALTINVLFGVAKWLIVKRGTKVSQKFSGSANDALVAMARRTQQILILGVTLLIGTRYLDLAASIDRVLIKVATVSAFLQFGLWLSGALDFWIDRYRHTTTNKSATTSLSAVSFIGKLLLWALILMLMLDNLGVNVTAMVAGLGVGGIAVALAVQNILGDLFASLSIVVDKPFVVGDSITVDSFTGTVEQVGLKTTRLRSSTGEQIIISNSDLLKTRIRNFKRMRERRMLFTFGVVYEIAPDLLARVPGMVREIVEAVPKTRFERAHFKGFGASSLDFEVVYWMLTADANASLDAQQEINLALFRRFGEEGIAFAYPTQTLIVQGQAEQFPGAAPAAEAAG